MFAPGIRIAPRVIAVISVLGMLLELSACGGGGGGGSSGSGGSGGGGGSGGSGGGGGTSNLPTFSLSTNAVSFSTTATNLYPQNPSVFYVTGTVTGSASGTLYIVVDEPNPNVATVSNFTITGNSTGQAAINPGSPTTLGAGSFSEALTVKACLNDPTCATGQLQGSPQTVTVNYTIVGLSSTTSALTYSIGNAPTSADYGSTFQVTGYPVQTWTATSNVPWLAVTPVSGSTASAVSVSVALGTAQVNALNGGTYTGTVTLTPTSGLPVTIPVSLTIARTQVDYVAPYIALSGTPGNVIIRGEKFSLVTPTGVNFGTTPATSFSVISDTEIHATYPALQAGTYTVHVVNTQGIDRTNAQLTVVNPTTFAAGTLQYPSTTGTTLVTGLVYDAARQALLVNIWYPPQGSGSGLLLRYGYTSGWSAPTSVALPGNSVIAESVDGTTVFAAYADPTLAQFTLAQLDPVSLAAVKTVTNTEEDVTGTSIAPSNNGHVIIAATSPTDTGDYPIFDYSMLNGSLVWMGEPVGVTGTPGAAASIDGSTVLIQSTSGLLMSQTQLYDSNLDTLTWQRTAPDARAVQLNRDGSRVLLTGLSYQRNIYDANFNLLGGLPASSQASVFGPVSALVYTFDSNGTVRIFDTSQPTVGGIYPEILPALTPIQNPTNSNYIPTLAITPDERTLFLAADAQIVIVPLP